MHGDGRKALNGVVSPSGLSVTITNIRNDNGNVVGMVFDDRNAFKVFDVSKAVGYKLTPAAPGRVGVRCPELKRGPYAIGAFHDEDKNQDLNTSGQIPTEGYATSGATDARDTPTFRRASVPSGAVDVVMYYWE